MCGNSWPALSKPAICGHQILLTPNPGQAKVTILYLVELVHEGFTISCLQVLSFCEAMSFPNAHQCLLPTNRYQLKIKMKFIGADCKNYIVWFGSLVSKSVGGFKAKVGSQLRRNSVFRGCCTWLHCKGFQLWDIFRCLRDMDEILPGVRNPHLSPSCQHSRRWIVLQEPDMTIEPNEHLIIS